SRPTERSATVLGAVAGAATPRSSPLPWTRGLLQNRRHDMTDADRKALDEAMHHRAPGSPPPQPHVTLITTNELDQRGYGSLTVKVDRTSDVEPVAASIRTLGVGAATALSFVDQQLKVF